MQQDRDARLRYQLATTAEQHKLTKVTARHGTVYTVATDELKDLRCELTVLRGRIVYRR